MNQLMHKLTTTPTPEAWWTPAVDIEETDEECVIEIDLPGATAHDVALEWNDDRSLTVRGTIPAREHTGVLHRHTRHAGPVHHTIALPCSVRGDQLTATLTHGVLTIRAAKTHPGRAQIIHIVDPDAPGGVQS
jgi:HSP20 family protein